jgi:hypothetical protein
VTPTAPSPAATNGQAKTGKPTGSIIHYTPSSSALAISPASAAAAQKKPKPAAPAQ